MTRAWKHRTTASLLLAALAVAATALTACASVDFTPPSANPPASTLGVDASGSAAATATAADSQTAGSNAPVGTTSPALPGSEPSLTLDGSHAGTVRGTLVHKDIEGGVYVIVDSRPGAGAATAKTLVVISNADAWPLAALKDTYVEAKGSILQGGASTNMAGPQMAITAITPAK